MCVVPPAELGGTKANLVTDIQSYEQLKQKKKKKKKQQCSGLLTVLFIFFVLWKGWGEFLFFFPFHYNTSELDEIPLKGNARGGEYTKCLRGSNYEYNGPSGCRWNLQMH